MGLLLATEVGLNGARVAVRRGSIAAHYLMLVRRFLALAHLRSEW